RGPGRGGGLHRNRRHLQVVQLGARRADRGARPRLAADRARLFRLDRRAFGLRQVDAAADRRRPAGADLGADAAQCAAGDRAAGRVRVRLPAVHALALPVEDRGAQRRLRPRGARAPVALRDRSAGARFHRPGQAERLRAPLSVAALGRDAAAGRHRPRARVRPGRAADGRTLQLRRLAHPGRAAGAAPALVEGARLHGRLRHPRHRRGDLPVDPRGRAQQASRIGRHGPAHRSAAAARPDRDPGASRLPRLSAPHPRSAVRRRRPAAGGARGLCLRLDAMARFSGRWLGFALIAALLALWEIASVLKWVDTFTVPRMSSVATTIWDLLRSGVLPREAGASLWRMFAGYAIGVVSGIAVGMLMGSFRPVYYLLEPLTEILRPIPSPAYVPLAILFLGIDDEMKVFMIAFASFFPVLLNTYSGVRSV